MFGYLFKRCILVMFIGMTVLFTLSFYIPDYHYTKYHNVKILSEKVENVRNRNCDTKEHDHYVIKKITVQWVGETRNGVKEEFTDEFYDTDDDNDGVSYQDLKKGFAEKHNCGRSWLTLVGFILFTFAFLFIYLPEDLEDDYYYAERVEIKSHRLKFWTRWATFLGYDPKVIETVIAAELNKSTDRIPRYTNLFSKYKEEQVKLSQIQVETND